MFLVENNKTYVMKNKIKSNSTKTSSQTITKRKDFSSILNNSIKKNKGLIPDHLKEYVNLNYSSLFIP